MFTSRNHKKYLIHSKLILNYFLYKTNLLKLIDILNKITVLNI